MNNTRALIITFFVIAAFIGLVIQLFSIQIGNHEKYLAKAVRQQNKVHKIRAERGIIYDREKEIIAFTKDDISLFADARMLNKKSKVKSREKLANELAKVFGKKPETYIDLIKNSKKNICLEKKVPREKGLLLDNLAIEGFYKVEDFTRVYPYGNSMSHILGYLDNLFQGKSGIEKVYDKELTGVDGELHILNDVIGRTVSIDFDHSISAIAGNSIQLTINKVYQKILVSELQKGIEKFKGKSGIGIISNPNTGEILALANLPDFDPNNYHKYSDFERRNRVLTDTYEPGSTMKSIIMAILMDENLISENQIINTENGSYKMRGAIIRDTHQFSKLTVREVLEQSSNIGMAKLSEKINERDFYKKLRDFNFGNFTSIDLPGETPGSLKKPDTYSAITKAFISHGYEISVTPIQMITAYSALINGGFIMQPYLLKRIIDNNNQVIKENYPKKIRRVIDEETSYKMRDLLLGVVENGTGINAQLDNIYIGGKTGTSQKLIDGKYSRNNYNSSFIGFFPADKPELICLILIDSPEIGRYGGQVAAPIFREVTKKIIETDLNIKRSKNPIQRQGLIDNLITEIEIKNHNSDLIKLANVSNQKNNINNKNINRTTMPNLINKSIREAISILSEMGIEYKINGSGRVIKQSIIEGTVLKPKMFCFIECTTAD